MRTNSQTKGWVIAVVNHEGSSRVERDSRYVFSKRFAMSREYRTPCRYRLSRTRATRAAATSGLWTGCQQSARSVLYLRISHPGETSERAHGTSILHAANSPRHTTAERIDLFFSSSLDCACVYAFTRNTQGHVDTRRWQV